MDLASQQSRQQEILNRIREISVPTFKAQPKKKVSAVVSSDKSNVVAVHEKTDTHWDFLLKEMQWLAADFTAERKRHISASKKLGASVVAYQAGAAQRDAKAIQDAMVKRRKLAAKISRECAMKWWNKLDRVITYKQKLSYDQCRAEAMNQQLVRLVQQTEKYTASLGTASATKDAESIVTIEEALARQDATRRSKQRVRDYTSLILLEDRASGAETSLYGESTEDSAASSDATWYSDNDDDDAEDSDDESTLRAAEAEERRERRRQQKSDADSDDETSSSSTSFVADPVELRKLQEESTMDIDLVLERLQNEAGGADLAMHRQQSSSGARSPTTSGRTKVVERTSPSDPGSDADDDMDASDVEDYVNTEIQEEDGESESDNSEQHMTNEGQQDRVSSSNRRDLSSDELRDRYRVLAETALANYMKRQDEDSGSASSPRVQRERRSRNEDSDEEFKPTETIDDETTMEAEEKLGREMSCEDEIALLKRESEMSIDELRALYLGNTAGSQDDDDDETAEESGTVDEATTEDVGMLSKKESNTLRLRETEVSLNDLQASGASNDDGESAVDEMNVSERLDSLQELLTSVEDQENDEDFHPDKDVKDDESTLEAEERLGREMSVEEELALLRAESELPVEDLRRMYQSVAGQSRDEARSVRKRRMQKSTDEGGSTKKQRSDDDTLNAMDRLEASAELARRTMASRPFLIPNWVKLREYQQIGLNWLVSLQARRLNGILADEMGLGKTLQTIALLAYLAAYKGIWGPHLIVVPTSVILNWETELKRFCPALKVLCYYGSAKRRKELRTGWTKANWHHVVITSYQLVVQDSFAFKRKRWYYLVLDEAQHIKNFQSQRWQTLISFNTQRRLLLTGTPLQNNLMELWSLLHFLMPYIFRSRKEFSFWFANPMNSIIEGSANQNDDVIQRLHGIIRPFVLRRLKKDVETQMPGKFEHIVKCHLSRRQMFIYEEFMARSSTRQALKGGNFMGMMNVLMQLRKVCNHPDLFEPRSVVTPFVVDPIVLSMPLCVPGMTANDSIFAKVSDSLVSPLWSGSEGSPSMEGALRHDMVVSEDLLLMEELLELPAKPSLVLQESGEEFPVCASVLALAEVVLDRQYRDRVENRKFINGLNSSRCRARPFPYPQRLLTSVFVPPPALRKQSNDVLSTPSELLAMRRNQMERADDLSGLIKRFVFAVPKAGARPVIMSRDYKRPDIFDYGIVTESLLGPLEESLRPFRSAHARLTSFFPDKELVQFDAGKLQALAELLRERKRGGHKVLIFTQMSKMLDILEAFLNMNGHTYVRLDGGTSIDQRQRLMDRFNNDTKIFCFILSTRSGGTGVNLIGADTVVFYDSDWNPAQDAQAQDRAHRIGQTREVHIYRLITEHTVEENILLKAKQKRNLDILVMDKGNFNASQLHGGSSTPAEVDSTITSDPVNNLYTKGGLRAILGVDTVEDMDTKRDDDFDISNDQVEKTMTSLEDVDDAEALRGARIEAAKELQEFDETIEYKKDSDAEDDDDAKAEKAAEKTEDPKNDEKELEKELADWQDKVGMDAAAIVATLSPVERYGLNFHELIDPFYSMFAVLEYRRKMEAQEERNDDVDIDEIEREKALEEAQAFDDGDLLSTNPRPQDLIRQRNLYNREKARLLSSKKRRKLAGDDWECRTDERTQNAFWYNIDTGEAIWDKPKVILEREAYDLAFRRKWAALPMKPLIHVMSFLSPFPDRMKSSQVCVYWRKAATDTSFVRHVYPVEQGAYTMEDAMMEYNHYRTIEDALKAAIPGDTIELADGHYWHNADMVIAFPLRFVGDEHNPSNVVIEMSGTIIWQAGGGFFEGVTFRRPKISSEERFSKEMLRIEPKGKLDIIQSVFDNEGSAANVTTLHGPGNKGRWENVMVRQGNIGVSLRLGARLDLLKAIVTKNESSGVLCENLSDLNLVECRLEKNKGHGIDLRSQSSLTIRVSRVLFNGGKVLSKEAGCIVKSSGNLCTRSPNDSVAPLGFQFADE